jgi:hypothetical protein
VKERWGGEGGTHPHFSTLTHNTCEMFYIHHARVYSYNILGIYELRERGMYRVVPLQIFVTSENIS